MQGLYTDERWSQLDNSRQQLSNYLTKTTMTRERKRKVGSHDQEEEVCANQVDLAESRYNFVIGRASPLVTSTRLDTYFLATTGRISGNKDGEFEER